MNRAGDLRQLFGASLRWAQYNGLFFALVALILVFTLLSDRFFTLTNAKLVLEQVSVVGIIAIPGAMLLLAGYLDLSVGSVAVLAATIFGSVFVLGLPLGLCIAIALLVGCSYGLLNGVLIAGFKLSPVVVTLGGLAGARGLAELITKGTTNSGFGNTFEEIGNGVFLGLRNPVWILFVVVAIGAYFWYLTPTGRRLMAIGSDDEAARSLGIPVRRTVMVLYVLSGLAAAAGGLISASQLASASFSIGEGLELQVLTAILLGGVSFQGGRGSLFGVMVGILFIGVLYNGLVVTNVDPFFQDVAVGAALVFAGALDILHRRLDRVQITREAEAHEADVGVDGGAVTA